jgi:integrase/recombinase XerD
MLCENGRHKNGHKPSRLEDCFLDFMLSRQAMLCTPRTLKFYRDTLGKFMEWMQKQGVTKPTEITSKHIRAFLATYVERGCKDSYIHTYARSSRTFLRFLHQEGYIPEQISFQMPKIGEKRLPILSIAEVKQVVKACMTTRDKAIILFLVDTGLRLTEATAMNWGDIDIESGMCHVRNGKGKKDRSVVIGITTRRTLLKYRQEMTNHDDCPLFQTQSGNRLSPGGLRSMCVRLSNKTGVHINPHALRRTFVVMSLKGGMSPSPDGSQNPNNDIGIC